MPILARHVIFALALTACSRQPEPRRHPIDTVNPVIGDLGFIRAHGRAPTPEDDPTARVHAHLAYVEQLLRGADVSGLSPAQRAGRDRALDDLHRYGLADRFPASETVTGMLPTFIDRAGIRCAVAYLVEQDLGEAAIRQIDRRYHNAYIAEIDAPALAAWAAAAGLSRADLALIQPSYPPQPLGGMDLELGLAAEYGSAVSEPERAGERSYEALLRGYAHRILRHNYYVGEPVIGIDGAAGWAAGGHVAYDAHLTLGTQQPFRLVNTPNSHLIGVTAGLGVDAIGDRIPRAWTVPVDAFYYFRHGHRTSIGVTAGPRFAIAGADRGIGWRAAVAVIRRGLIDTDHALAPRDLRVELGVEHIADATLVTLAVGLAARSRYGYWSD